MAEKLNIRTLSECQELLRILEVFNATGLTAHQAKRCLERVRVLIELGERVASRTEH